MNIEQIEAARSAMVREVVEAMSNAGEPLSHESVAARLPDDFRYSAEADDYERFTSGDMAATETADGSAKPEVSSRESLRQRVFDLDQACADGRANIVVLDAQLARARGKMADALVQWHTGARRVTAEDNARAYIKSEQEERARLAEHGPTAVEQPSPGNSVIDRQAAYSHGGNASDHVRGQMRTGYRRGSMPASARGTRLPSNRV